VVVRNEELEARTDEWEVGRGKPEMNGGNWKVGNEKREGGMQE
jgi:hypothetical protein